MGRAGKGDTGDPVGCVVEVVWAGGGVEDDTGGGGGAGNDDGEAVLAFFSSTASVPFSLERLRRAGSLFFLRIVEEGGGLRP